MKRRRVQVTATAREQIRAVKAWQRENGVDVTTLANEIEEAFTFLSLIPAAGSPYSCNEVPDAQRLFLRRVSYHLYYTFSEDKVVIRALWHTSRGHGPDLAW